MGDFSPVAVSLPQFLYSSLSLSFSVCLFLPHPPSHSQLLIWFLFSHSFIHSSFTAKPVSTLHSGSFPAELCALRTPTAAFWGLRNNQNELHGPWALSSSTERDPLQEGSKGRPGHFLLEKLQCFLLPIPLVRTTVLRYEEKRWRYNWL